MDVKRENATFPVNLQRPTGYSCGLINFFLTDNISIINQPTNQSQHTQQTAGLQVDAQWYTEISF